MLETLFAWYEKFLGLFPAGWQAALSILIILFLAGTIWTIIKKSGLWLFLLVLLIPASLPALRTIGQSLVDVFEFLLSKSSV